MRIEEYAKVIEWLRRYLNGVWKCERLAEEVMRWDAKAEKITPTLSAVPCCGGAGQAILNAIQGKESALEKLSAEKDIMEDARREIEEAIGRLEIESHRRVLYCMYIDGFNQRTTAQKLHYSPKQVGRIHQLALEEIKRCTPMSSNNVIL